MGGRVYRSERLAVVGLRLTKLKLVLHKLCTLQEPKTLSKHDGMLIGSSK